MSVSTGFNSSSQHNFISQLSNAHASNVIQQVEDASLAKPAAHVHWPKMQLLTWQAFYRESMSYKCKYPKLHFSNSDHLCLTFDCICVLKNVVKADSFILRVGFYFSSEMFSAEIRCCDAVLYVWDVAHNPQLWPFEKILMCALHDRINRTLNLQYQKINKYKVSLKTSGDWNIYIILTSHSVCRSTIYIKQLPEMFISNFVFRQDLIK